MRSYDSLLESDPEFQQKVAEAKQVSAIIVVEARFPNLVELARRRIVRLNKIDELNTITRLIASAPMKKLLVGFWIPLPPNRGDERSGMTVIILQGQETRGRDSIHHIRLANSPSVDLPGTRT